MVQIRPCRARLRTALIIAPFLASGVAFAASAGAQELPGGLATDLFEQALNEQIAVPSVDARGQDSIPTILAWIVGLVIAGLVMRRLRGELGRVSGRSSASAPPRHHCAALRPLAKRGLTLAGDGPQE